MKTELARVKGILLFFYKKNLKFISLWINTTSLNIQSNVKDYNST